VNNEITYLKKRRTTKIKKLLFKIKYLLFLSQKSLFMRDFGKFSSELMQNLEEYLKYYLTKKHTLRLSSGLSNSVELNQKHKYP
jgi:hypothetical protein